MVRPAGVAEQMVVPARPGAPAPRQHRRVGVEHRLVGLVGDRAQDLVAPRRWRRPAGASAWSEWVASTTSSKRLGLAATWGDEHVVGLAPDGPHRGAQAQAPREAAQQRLDVPGRAAADGPPARPVPEREHAVVVEELDQEAGGEVPHLPRVGRPHRRRLRHDQALDERPARSRCCSSHCPSDGPSVARPPVPQQFTGGAVEAGQVGDHAVKPRGDQMRPLGEQAIGRARRCTRSLRGRR